MKFDKTTKTYRQINDFIRGELARQKISQEELAYRLCMKQQSVSQRLNGKVEWSLKEIIDVYDILGIEHDWL
jgi:transcriptional regulator with XRE-family HTH domain